MFASVRKTTSHDCLLRFSVGPLEAIALFTCTCTIKASQRKNNKDK